MISRVSSLSESVEEESESSHLEEASIVGIEKNYETVIHYNEKPTPILRNTKKIG